MLDNISALRQINADVAGGSAHLFQPADAILMRLAHAYAQKGNREEARKTFAEVVDKHPDSPYTPEARTELENLKG